MTDYRSPEAQRYRRWYKTAAWRGIRARQLKAEPLCLYCSREGRITPATVCDHVTPHRGDEAAFFAGPFQSLCKPHHDQAKQQEERIGYSTAVGADGFPSDDNHPFNRGGG